MQHHATIFAVASFFLMSSLAEIYSHSLCHSTEAKNVPSADFLKWSLRYVQTEGLETAELISTLLFAQTSTFTKPMPREIDRSLLRLRLQLAAECNDGMLCRPSRNMGWGWVARCILTWIYRCCWVPGRWFWLFLQAFWSHWVDLRNVDLTLKGFGRKDSETNSKMFRLCCCKKGLSLVADLMHYIYRGSTAVGRLQIGAFDRSSAGLLRLFQAGTNSTFGHFSWRSLLFSIPFDLIASYSHMIKSYLIWSHRTGFGLLPAQRLEDGISSCPFELGKLEEVSFSFDKWLQKKLLQKIGQVGCWKQVTTEMILNL